MKLVNQNCEVLFQEFPISIIDFKENYLKYLNQHIERCGRCCYHSQDKITEGSSEKFVQRLINNKHLAMLEHGVIYLTLKEGDNPNDWKELYSKYTENPYSRVKIIMDSMYITTNYRVIIENSWDDDLKYVSFPTENHVKRYTLKCTTALHCYKDLTRHRVFSFAIESTRYCNYSNTDKFGEMSFIRPTWLIQEDTEFVKYLINVELVYTELINKGWKAQQAAEVLPQCIKGDMIITGFEDDWKELINLRYYGTTGAPHPMVKELATLMKENLEKLGLVFKNPKEND